VNRGFSFRAAPGLRLRATRRGPRVSLGPRIARIHVGSGRADPSAEHVRSAEWSELSAGGHAPSPRPGGGRKAKVWHDQRSHLDALLTAHETEITRAQPPELPQPPPVEPRHVRRELRRRSTAEIPRLRVRAWLEARRDADQQVDAEVTHRQREQADAHAARQAEAETWWEALLANVEPVVIEHLHRCFDAHEIGATATAVGDATAYLVVPVDTPERLIGKREPTVTAEGKHKLPIMSKPRRHELYVQAIGSAILAVAAETFAVAPGIEAIEVAVVEPAHPAGPAVIALCELRRATVLPEGAERAVVTDLDVAAEEGQVRLVLERSGQARAPSPLSRDDPSVDTILSILEVE
jgi:hypothetical protein